jgi:hypothetical protein
MRSSPSASKAADARKRMKGVISSAQEQLEKNRELFNSA